MKENLKQINILKNFCQCPICISWFGIGCPCCYGCLKGDDIPGSHPSFILHVKLAKERLHKYVIYENNPNGYYARLYSLVQK